MTDETEKPAKKKRIYPKKPPTGRPPGRPSQYTDWKAKKICEYTAAGMSLRQIAMEPYMPERQAIATWLQEHPDFFEKYKVARNICYEKWADEVNTIADEPAVNMAEVQRARLRTDSRKWLLSKLVPKTYGDKVQAEVTGKDGSPVEFKMVLDKDDKDEK